jgi:hypothetical protein
MHKYLRIQKVIDRYMNLYHPRAEHAATQHCFIELTNADRSKCVIYQDAKSGKEVVVYPKALQPDLSYSLRFRYGNEAYSKTGSELMQSGIVFRDTTATQMIFLNLDDFPGSGMDSKPPSSPVIIKVQKASFCGHEGTAVEWTECKDNQILAGYQIYRNGQKIDFVAIGTFYFDETPGNNFKARYKIMAVDGDGNISDKE